ncbi:sigma 54 modulation protein [Caballeronia terrestris]|uniref:Sigma 54 modulation protein n=2 Tax=Caballeronia TaxID=1827195 RepID=A0A158KYS5_9BURK|nr:MULTISPECIES: HPF/RaiA family ribosome-associated protein [Caballeronia]SAL68258.1 sigma 54 modulation protein [Caballeronia humi]SAL86298.1 sigma 54 modulation protein [Caballeronia terrestris]
MKRPLEVFFQGIPHSDAIEASIKRHATKLDGFCSDIMRCRVSVMLNEKHRNQGKLFNVRVDTTIPGHELVSNREHDEDVYVAIRDAFKDATRMLEDAVRKRRGQIKQHEARIPE